MKATQKHLDLFKKKVLKWLDTFEISGWEYYFEFDESDKENTAGARWDLEGRTITFELNRKQEKRDLTDEAINISALHEVLHLIFARLLTLANRRFTTETEMKEASEEAVNILRNYIEKHD